MKKLVAALFALSVPLMAVQAQDTTQTVGTYSGRVAPKCFATAPTYTTTGLTPNAVGADQFSSELRGTGTFNFRSNTPSCRVQNISEILTVAPGETASDFRGVCAAVPNALGTATEREGKPVVVNAAVIDDGDEVLLAGEYVLRCTVTLTTAN